MRTPDRPWTRIRTPEPIPQPLTRDAIDALPDAQFANLVRSHLVPRDQTPEGRQAWNRLWTLLKRTDNLANRTLDTLEVFLYVTNQALAGGTLDDAETARARKFQSQCDQAWQRVDNAGQGALAWAGSAGDFQPRARRVIAALVGAIARHRSASRRSGQPASAADQELWATLSQVNLDPDDYPDADDPA